MSTLNQHDNAFSLGYYQVGTTKYADKLPALLDATIHDIHPEWNFHRDVFDHFDWQHSTGISLREMYRRRALQLREKYDYLTLHYSGGSDSYTILRAFLDNKIKLDEVYVRWAIKALEGTYTPNAADKRPENIVSEWDLTIKPDLEYLAKYHPEIKLTVVDWSEEIEPVLGNLKDMDVFNMGTDWLNIGAFLRLRSTSSDNLIKMSRGQGAAAIFGVDKPRVIKKGNEAFIYFLDMITNFSGSHRDKNVEAFFWTPDMPEMIREQSHVILNYFRANPDLQHLLDFNVFSDPVAKNLYDQLTRSLVYPDWDPKKFQAKKVTSVFYMELDKWLHQRFEGRVTQSWQWQINNIVSGIDPKYIKYKNNRADGFVGFVSPFYKIGNFETVAI